MFNFLPVFYGYFIYQFLKYGHKLIGGINLWKGDMLYQRLAIHVHNMHSPSPCTSILNCNFFSFPQPNFNHHFYQCLMPNPIYSQLQIKSFLINNLWMKHKKNFYNFKSAVIKHIHTWKIRLIYFWSNDLDKTPTSRENPF